MNTRPLLPISLLAGLMIALLCLPAVPLSYAAPPAPGQYGNATVRGRALASGQPVAYAYVWVAPLNTQGDPDYQNERTTWTDGLGNFELDIMPRGNYTMDIEPDCAPGALPLFDRRFSVNVIGGVVALGDIALPTAPKQIQGMVTRAGAPVANAFVVAFNTDDSSYRCAVTDPNGLYTLGVGGGEWEVSVEPEPGALWMFTQMPPVVRIGTATTSTVNLTVQPTDGFLVGQVLTPAGMPLLPVTGPGTNFSAYVDVWNEANNSYNYAYPSATGTFTVPVVAGHYQVAVSVDETDYPNYAGPPEQLVEIGTETLDLNQIRLLRRSSGITGSVKNSGGASIANAIVQAYQSGGGFDYDYTDITGRYNLRVAAGDWNVRVFPPEDAAYLDNGSSQAILATDNVTTTLNFALQPAAAQIEGALVDQQGAPLTDVDAWAYARKANTQEYVAIERVSHGWFSLQVPNGALRVGVFLAPGSPYSLVGELNSPALANAPQLDQSLSTAAMAQLEQEPYEQLVSVPPADTAPAQAIRSVQIRLARHDAKIRGTLRDQSGKPVIGVSGVVEASPANANSTWQWATLNPSNGTFELSLTAGDWYLSYDLDGDQYGSNAAGPLLVKVGAGQTVTQDLAAVRYDGVLQGQVRDDKQQPMPGTYVWLRGKHFEQFVLTDAEGRFMIYAPLRDGSALARYTLGTNFSCVVGKPCLLDVDPLPATVAPRSSLTMWVGPAQHDIILKAKGSVESENVRVSGRVIQSSDHEQAAIAGAAVTFVPEGGRKGTDYTDANGNYSLDATVTRGQARIRYTATAGIVEGSDYFTISRRDRLAIEGRLRSALAGPGVSAVGGLDLGLQQVAVLPKSETQVFNVVDGWSHTLSDGTQIQIPANAVPVDDGETQVHVAIEAAPFLQPSNLYDPAVYYGYRITLAQAQSGKQILQPLKADALLTLRYDEGVLAQNYANETQIRPASFSGDLWQPSERFVTNTASNKLTIQTRTLGTWALVRPHIAGLAFLPTVRR